MPAGSKLKPRAVFNLANISAEVWCISDLLEDLPNNPQNQSSSQRKMERLPAIFGAEPPSLVVAVGTAGLPSELTENGSVVIGTGVFMHDCHPNGTNPDSRWNTGPFDEVLNSGLTKATFTSLTQLDTSAQSRLLTAPLNPAWQPRILSRYSYVALAAVNVTDYAEYEETDLATLDTFLAKYPQRNAKSLETTHGLIRASSSAPFIFVSGITDRVGFFADEVGPRSYAQNSVAAHNAGVAVAWMLPNIDAKI